MAYNVALRSLLNAKAAPVMKVVTEILSVMLRFQSQVRLPSHGNASVHALHTGSVWEDRTVADPCGITAADTRQIPRVCVVPGHWFDDVC